MENLRKETLNFLPLPYTIAWTINLTNKRNVTILRPKPKYSRDSIWHPSQKKKCRLRSSGQWRYIRHPRYASLERSEQSCSWLSSNCVRRPVVRSYWLEGLQSKRVLSNRNFNNKITQKVVLILLVTNSEILSKSLKVDTVPFPHL